MACATGVNEHLALTVHKNDMLLDISARSARGLRAELYGVLLQCGAEADDDDVVGAFFDTGCGRYMDDVESEEQL